jgi:uncharacterized protein YecE (DUF72 family)
MGKSRILVGTSSWADPGFVEDWYPEGLPARDRLAWYAEHFEAVEVNSTFYAIPSPSTIRRWAEVTPDKFVFDVKLHKLLSRHSAEVDTLPARMRRGVEINARGRVKLSERLEAALCEGTLEAMEPLREAGKLGGFLLQLSPGFGPRDHVLDELLPVVEGLAPWPVAIELRNRSWVKPERLEETLGWYEAHRAVWVGVDAPQGDHFTLMPAVDAATHPEVAYLRAHGRNLSGFVKGRSVAERFDYRYPVAELREIAARAESLAEEVGSVRVYFNNNKSDYAPVAAERFRELVGDRAAA